MRMHHDRPSPSPGPARIVEFIKRLSNLNLVKLSRLLAEDQEFTKAFSCVPKKRRTNLWYGIDEKDIEDEL